MRRKEKQAPVDLINRKGEEQMQTSPSKMRRKEVPVDHIKLEEDSMLSSSSKMIRTEIPVDHIKQEEDSIQPSPSKKRKKEVTTALTPQHETSLQTDGLNRISLRLPEDPDTSRIQTDIGILALRVLSRKNNKVTNQRDLIRSTFINLYNSKNKASRTLPKEKVISNQNQQRNKKFDPVPFKQKRKVGLPVHEKQKKLMEQLPSVQLKKEETLAPTHQKSHT
ncbi:unnamed protein product [Allacma fusca]|uniref:Uncharacterized protein n=1 Tax=Allacma fusca TaxID=39272 RepID=A0A8J2J2G6_9HEXA|nr:unnamed protein product [Allacma fusca]